MHRLLHFFLHSLKEVFPTCTIVNVSIAFTNSYPALTVSHGKFLTNFAFLVRIIEAKTRLQPGQEFFVRQHFFSCLASRRLFGAPKSPALPLRITQKGNVSLGWNNIACCASVKSRVRLPHPAQNCHARFRPYPSWSRTLLLGLHHERH